MDVHSKYFGKNKLLQSGKRILIKGESCSKASVHIGRLKGLNPNLTLTSFFFLNSFQGCRICRISPWFPAAYEDTKLPGCNSTSEGNVATAKWGNIEPLNCFFFLHRPLDGDDSTIIQHALCIFEAKVLFFMVVQDGFDIDKTGFWCTVVLEKAQLKKKNSIEYSFSNRKGKSLAWEVARVLLLEMQKATVMFETSVALNTIREF